MLPRQSTPLKLFCFWQAYKSRPNCFGFRRNAAFSDYMVKVMHHQGHKPKPNIHIIVSN